MTFSNLANDTKRQFLLCMTAKACYFFQSWRKQLLPIEVLKTRHRLINYTETGVVRRLPDRSGSAAWFSSDGECNYYQFNSEDEWHGIAENWSDRYTPSGRPVMRNFQNGRLEGLLINYADHIIYVFHRGKERNYYNTDGLGEEAFCNAIKEAQQAYQAIVEQETD